MRLLVGVFIIGILSCCNDDTNNNSNCADGEVSLFGNCITDDGSVYYTAQQDFYCLQNEYSIAVNFEVNQVSFFSYEGLNNVKGFGSEGPYNLDNENLFFRIDSGCEVNGESRGVRITIIDQNEISESTEAIDLLLTLHENVLTTEALDSTTVRLELMN